MLQEKTENIDNFTLDLSDIADMGAHATLIRPKVVVLKCPFPLFLSMVVKNIKWRLRDFKTVMVFGLIQCSKMNVLSLNNLLLFGFDLTQMSLLFESL